MASNSKLNTPTVDTSSVIAARAQTAVTNRIFSSLRQRVEQLDTVARNNTTLANQEFDARLSTMNDTLQFVRIESMNTVLKLQNAGGDLSGPFTNMSVNSIQSIPFVLTSPSLNNILVFDGTSWVNAGIPSHTHVKADVTDFAHTHAGADIITGTVDYARLPTGTAASTVAIGNHTHTLDGLSDVAITSPTYRDTILYNGSSWVNSKDEYVVTTFADVTLTNGTAAQSVFAAADDTIALPAASAWFVQGSYVIASGTILHTTAISFLVSGVGGSSGTINFRVNSFPAGAYGTVGRAQDTVAFNSAAGGVINAANTGALIAISFEGVYTCPDAVTFTPQLTFSAAPGGTNLTKVGSYIRLTRLFGADNTAADAAWT